MSDELHFLQQRNSAPKLTEPAPSAAQRQAIFRAALRAPDHAWLRPWRFITVEGGRRDHLGELLERCLLLRNPGADEAARLKARNAPLRAPLLVVVVARLSEHPKVPPAEQRLSAACAAHAILLAAEACGFAGIWRTGDAAYDRAVMRGLGLTDNEEIVAFIYLGTRDGAAKNIPPLDTADFVSTW
ncbi:MAG: nitroreductase family protein [Halioglobus sp.]